jgi:hypothetical protein
MNATSAFQPDLGSGGYQPQTADGGFQTQPVILGDLKLVAALVSACTFTPATISLPIPIIGGLVWPQPRRWRRTGNLGAAVALDSKTWFVDIDDEEILLLAVLPPARWLETQQEESEILALLPPAQWFQYRPAIPPRRPRPG